MTPPGNSVPFDIVFFPISCQIGALPKIRRLFDHVTSANERTSSATFSDVRSFSLKKPIASKQCLY
uniref:TYROSINE PHOSPHATASE 1 family protein n=1 Tax=Rhizophora mucronata TaxID=61149 RepID=A0A2P2LCA7_RHIMU